MRLSDNITSQHYFVVCIFFCFLFHKFTRNSFKYDEATDWNSTQHQLPNNILLTIRQQELAYIVIIDKSALVWFWDTCVACKCVTKYLTKYGIQKGINTTILTICTFIYQFVLRHTNNLEFKLKDPKFIYVYSLLLLNAWMNEEYFIPILCQILDSGIYNDTGRAWSNVLFPWSI